MPVRDRAWRPECRRTRSRAAAGRTDRDQQQGGGDDRRRARQAEGSAGLGRAAPGRAHVAQSAEVRRQCRSRAFHHSAAAGKAGRHADQRTVADRLSDRAISSAARSTISTSSSSTAIRTRASCRRSISTISCAMCATAAPCCSPRAPISPSRTGSIIRRSARIVAGAPDGELIERAFRPAISPDRRQTPGHARPAGLRRRRRRPGAAGSGRSMPTVTRGHQRPRRRRRQAAARALARGQGPRRPAALATRSGSGRAASRAAARISTCCAALAHWLMKEPELEEEALRATAKGRS